MTVWHCHIAISLDGKIARPDGSFDWLFDYPAEDFGIEAFLSGLDAMVMGRTTYEVERRIVPWPHADRPVFVVTSRPLVDPPPKVEACPDLAALVREVEAKGLRKIGVAGGGQLLRGLVALERLDRLEMAIVPIVLGDGIPLFPAGTPEHRLRLVSCAARTGGALHVVYERG